jgi:hypothetical protein
MQKMNTQHGNIPASITRNVRPLKPKRVKAYKPKQSDSWSTPRNFYDKLDAIHNFTFDPCPLNHDLSKWDGLQIDWCTRNFVNPPYSQPLLRQFVEKGLAESRKGKLCVFLIPASTDTKLFHDVILPNATSIEFVRGRLKFEGYNNKGEFCNAPAMKGSMIVIFDGR